MKIERTNTRVELEKRQRAPYLLIEKCTNCSKNLELDLSRDDYLSYPIVGVSQEVTFYCDDCDVEIFKNVIVNILIRQER